MKCGTWNLFVNEETSYKFTNLNLPANPVCPKECVISALEDPEVMSGVHGDRTIGLAWRQIHLPSLGLLCSA